MNITMIGRLRDGLRLTYRTPADSVRDLLPDGLDLVTRRGYAFWNLQMYELGRVRPAGLPAMFGVDYHHIAYRLQVRTAEGERPFHVRTDVDHRLAALIGNALTDFRIHKADIRMANGRIVAKTKGGTADVDLRIGKEAAARWSYFDYLMQNKVSLVRATRVAPVDYRWRLGRTLDLSRRPYGEEFFASGRA